MLFRSLVDQNDGLVVDSCYMLNQAGELESPWLGLPAGHSGPYALALKPQTVATTGHSLAFFRVSALRQSGAWPVSHPSGPSSWMIDLCGKLSENGWDIAFSPLVKGRSGTAFASPPSRSVPPMGTRKAEYGLLRYGRGRNYNG